MNIKIVDYKLGNIYNVAKAFQHLGVTAELSSNKEALSSASALVLPGVGAFGDAMQNLKAEGLDKVIVDYAGSGRPVFGICLGMQLFMTESREMGEHMGLGLINGKVLRFENKSDASENKIRVPLISWQDVQAASSDVWDGSPMKGLPIGNSFYFVHSYYVAPEDKAVIVGTSQYAGLNYCSTLKKENIFATQFHPEKSGEPGLQILRNWVEMCL